MRRRDFVSFLGGVAAWPHSAWAQQAGKMPRIGVLIPHAPEPFLGMLRDGLRRLGYIEGQNIHLEIRTAGGKPDLLAGLAAELVRLKVDIIVANQTPTVEAAKRATKEIPIVMAPAGDPIGTGLVASLARPGGNITGMSAVTAEMGGKLLELIRQLKPSAKRVGALANAADPFAKPFLEHIERGGRTLSIETPSVRIHGAGDFSAAFADFVKQRVDAVIVQPSLPRKPAIDLALKHRLPAVSPTSAFPEEGGLLSYAATLVDMYRESAVYVDKILRGAKPAELPVQQASKFELVVNLRTAKAIGLTVPKSVLERADRVIE